MTTFGKLFSVKILFLFPKTVKPSVWISQAISSFAKLGRKKTFFDISKLLMKDDNMIIVNCSSLLYIIMRINIDYVGICIYKTKSWIKLSTFGFFQDVIETWLSMYLNRRKTATWWNVKVIGHSLFFPLPCNNLTVFQINVSLRPI